MNCEFYMEFNLSDSNVFEVTFRGMTAKEAKKMYDLVTKHQPHDIREFGWRSDSSGESLFLGSLK